MSVPFFRPELSDEEIAEVVAALRSGWLTTGPRVARFEKAFAEAVGAEHALAVNSCTAAMHLATVALGLRRGQAVLVPTMTFAATAEVVLYAGAVPVLVDCDAETLNIGLAEVEQQVENLRAGRLPVDPDIELAGIMPVHVGGQMMAIGELGDWARREGAWLVEDAAHALPSAWRPGPGDAWQRAGEGTADVTCFSFYANKTLTTGEGGMAVTSDDELASEMRSLSLHGLSHDAWDRYTSKGAWDYRILAPGYKYNMTDVAAALGLHQLARVEAMRQDRQRIAERFSERLASVDELEVPPVLEDRLHSWHLYQIKLHLDRLAIDRDTFLEQLRARGVGFSVHWRPLHLHPLYAAAGWRGEHLPVASGVWQRTVSLPIFPAMKGAEVEQVIDAVLDICRRHRLRAVG